MCSLQNLSDYYGGDFEEVVPVEDNETVAVAELTEVLTPAEKVELSGLVNMNAAGEDELMKNYLIAKMFILNVYGLA